MPDDQAPPVAIEAEESVLGAMLVADPALRRVRIDTGLAAGHFYLDKHREIFAAILHVADRDGTADEILVANELPEHRDYIAELTAKVPAAANATHYARLVVDKANRRAKLEGAMLIQQGARELDEGRSVDLIQEGLQLAAADFSIEAEPTSGEEIMGELFDYLDDPLEPEVFELPWGELNDSVVGGYRRKQMSVIAGWPKMGKSFVLDQMLDAFAAQGKRCAIFAYEVSRMERAVRNLTMRTGIASEKVFRKQLTAEETKKAVAAMRGGLPFDYFEAAGWDVEKVAARIIYGNYDVVAIDPVTKMPGFEKTEIASNYVGRLTEISTRANCHVILVSHLHRGRGTSSDGVRPRPVASDLRGSGMIEGDAHAIMFLHRDQDERGNVQRTGELYIDRSRLGPPRSLRVAQLARTLQFISTEQADLLGSQTQLETGREAAHDRQAG